MVEKGSTRGPGFPDFGFFKRVGKKENRDIGAAVREGVQNACKVA